MFGKFFIRVLPDEIPLAVKRANEFHSGNPVDTYIGMLGQIVSRELWSIPLSCISSGPDGGLDVVIPGGRYVQVKTVPLTHAMVPTNFVLHQDSPNLTADFGLLLSARSEGIVWGSPIIFPTIIYVEGMFTKFMWDNLSYRGRGNPPVLHRTTYCFDRELMVSPDAYPEFMFNPSSRVEWLTHRKRNSVYLHPSDRLQRDFSEAGYFRMKVTREAERKYG